MMLLFSLLPPFTEDPAARQTLQYANNDSQSSSSFPLSSGASTTARHCLPTVLRRRHTACLPACLLACLLSRSLLPCLAWLGFPFLSHVLAGLLPALLSCSLARPPARSLAPLKAAPPAHARLGTVCPRPHTRGTHTHTPTQGTHT
jgi:hypothetical protein